MSFVYICGNCVTILDLLNNKFPAKERKRNGERKALGKWCGPNSCADPATLVARVCHSGTISTTVTSCNSNT